MKQILNVVTAFAMLASTADVAFGQNYGNGRGPGLGSDRGYGPRNGRWHDQRGQRFQGINTVGLGMIKIGMGRGGISGDVVQVGERLGALQCNLTHIKLSALNDSVYITQVEVDYKIADRYGKTTDVIDLRDDDDFGRAYDRRGDRRMAQGIQLPANQSSPWLDLDDVQDGFPTGRCVRAIRIYGIDTPDMGDRGGRMGHHGRGDMGRGDMRDCRGPRCPDPRFGNPPALVKVEGALMRMHRPHPPGPVPGPIVVPQPPPPPVYWGDVNRNKQLVYFGTTGTVSKSRFETKRIVVGANKGRFDGIYVQAKDDDFQARSVTVVFGNMSQVNYGGFTLGENRSLYLDFDRIGHGRRDNDRFIHEIIVEGISSNTFGSKARLDVSGGR